MNMLYHVFNGGIWGIHCPVISLVISGCNSAAKNVGKLSSCLLFHNVSKNEQLTHGLFASYRDGGMSLHTFITDRLVGFSGIDACHLLLNGPFPCSIHEAYHADVSR